MFVQGMLFVRACVETVQETQRSSFLTPLAPLIRGGIEWKVPPDKGDLGGWVFHQRNLTRFFAQSRRSIPRNVMP